MARKEPGGSGGTGPLGAHGGTIRQVQIGALDNDLDPAPSQRQNAAFRASGDRRAELALVRVRS